MMDRRKFLGAASMTSIAAFTAAAGGIAAMAKTDVSSIPDYDKWQLSEKEWKERLSPEAYNVLRKEGTERPWTSQFNDEKREGVFACAGCGFDLFTSDKKFDSGTGW
ncbi:MAG: peptide-methionine (R)-S-oxide reductase, partial [Amphiplicatus sp.]|nr:peptide-methionine (R)-S-oxide reductase [Amphiplicatus sp.]